jgi:gamma-glutamyltranspeptidase/glutathione hydrolase
MASDVLVPFTTVHATSGMVASADALATTAGVELLARGGSAVDAALAANSVLAVTGPHLCGMGGDLFALVHHQAGPPAALDASGRAGSGADPERLRAAGFVSMPFRHHPSSVTVPGCVDGWLALHERFGRLPLAEVLESAIRLARHGFPASPLLVASLRALVPPVSPPAAALAEQAQRPGDPVRRPGVADALEAVVREGRRGFYEGAFGEGLLALGGGEYEPADLARPLAAWVDPLGADAWGHRVWSMPPPSQGYLTLAGAWIAGGLALPDDPDDPQWPHLLVEAAVQAGWDRPEVLHEGADGAALLAPERLAPRRAAIGPDRASRAGRWGTGGDTTYLCAVDGDGTGVSLIQSNASGFGSHLFEPATGINLHNRGIGFSLIAGHLAEYGPGRRPPHTLSPALVTRDDGRLAAVLGTQGGDGQPQILLQVLARWLQAGQSPARAIGSPRWVLSGSGQGFDTWTAAGGPRVVVEAHAPPAWAGGLRSRGHRVETGAAFDHGFGHANLIVADPRGVLAAAADPRARIGLAAGR